MRDIEQFGTAGVTGTPTGLRNALDADGSSLDVIFADAIVAMEPTTVLEEAGIITVRQTPTENDRLSFPIVRNTQLTWVTIDPRNGNADLGSNENATALNRVEYKIVQPTVKTANIFLPESVSLLNKVDFDMFTQILAVDAKRKKEADALTCLTVEGSLTLKYSAGGFVSNGSVTTGSTLSLTDMLAAKRLLKTGSDPVRADFALMHSIQYEQINKTAQLAPGATSPGAMDRKVRFNEVGDIVNFNGLDLYETELMPSVTGSVTTAYVTTGHPVIIGKKGWAIGRGERMGMRISTEVRPTLHGQFKVVDMEYDHTVLVKESIVLLRASDT